MNNSTVEWFGRIATDRISKSPAFARHMLADVFRGFGVVSRLKKGPDLPGRGRLMYSCNEMMATSLLAKKDTVLVSIFTPCEVMHAMDLNLVFPEGLSCYMTASSCEKIFLDAAEANGVPESYCSFHKELIGIAQKGMLPKPACVVNTTMVCDANQLTFRWLAEYYGVPHFVLDVPQHYDERSEAYLTRQLRDMTAFLEEVTGRKLEKKKLAEVMACARRTLENYRTILALKAERYESLKMTAHMIDSFAFHVLLGKKEIEEDSQVLIRDLEKLPKKRQALRVLWVHVLPYWQRSMAEIFNYNDRVEVVACDMTFDHLDNEIDPRYPYESMARQILTDAYNGPADRRLNRALRYARDLNCDGILYFCHWGCKQTQGASVLAKQKFEKAGFPTLVIDGDACDPRNIQDGQMVTRVGAFIEQLEAERA